MTTDNGSIERKVFNGEPWVRVGFTWYPASEVPNPTYTAQPDTRMDFTKTATPAQSGKAMRERSVPRSRGKVGY